MSSPDSQSQDFGSAPARPRRWRHPAEAVLVAVASRLTRGRLSVDTPAGHRLVFDGQRPGPQATLVLHRWRALRRVLIGGDIGFAESYMDGDWSSPDLATLIEFAARNEADLAPPRAWSPLRLLTRLRHYARRNTRRGSRRNIAAHYDLGNEFYGRWLDRGMTYSSGIFTREDASLEEAQAEKNQRVIDLLDLEGDERVLEIGCGWGALAELLVGSEGCRVTGLTLSTEQLAFATARMAQAGLAERADLRLEDYRDIGGSFDRVVSIEMIEAVGEAHWPRYFETIARSLCGGGVAVLQAITIDDARLAAYRRAPDFIQRYIFPGGMLPSVAAMRRETERLGLVFESCESFGRSYERTLAEWQRRFQSAWPALAARGLTLRFKRMWEYYLAYCEAGFRNGAIDVGLYRIVKPGQ